MGMSGREVEGCTLREFNLRLIGYRRRQEREWDRTRHLMAYVFNFGGMGATEVKQPKDIYPLDIDGDIGIRPITTRNQAMVLLSEFE